MGVCFSFNDLLVHTPARGLSLAMSERGALLLIMMICACVSVCVYVGTNVGIIKRPVPLL